MLKRLFSLCIVFTTILSFMAGPLPLTHGQGKLVKIVVATTDLPAGYLIPDDALTLCDWPAEATPQNALTETRQAVQQIARIDIPRGMPVQYVHFGPEFDRQVAASFKISSDASTF